MENYYFKHPSHFGDMFGIFEEFYRSNSLADVVIAVDGKTINAHRIVLSAGSDYFRRALLAIKQPNHVPVLFISDVTYEDMEIILEFIYRGQIVVTRDKVDSLRQAAYKLRIKGFENFLRKPFPSNPNNHHFNNNSNNSGMSMGNQYKLTSGLLRNLSMLTEAQNKRTMQINEQQNENNNKRSRMNNNNNNSNYNMNMAAYNNALLNFTRTKEERTPKQHHHRGMSIVPNPNGYSTDPRFHTSPNALQQKFHLEQLLNKRASMESNRSQEGKLDLSIPKNKSESDSVSITPVRHHNNEQSVNSDSGKDDSCDEHEENQRNENTENSVMESAQDLSRKEPNMSSHENSNNNHNNTNDDADSEDGDENEVNYTYEMDPNALSWDQYNDENVPENEEAESDGCEDEEDLEAIKREQKAKLEALFALNQAMGKMQAAGGNQFPPQTGFFYCEHCPKYFFDEDHLQLHIKRSHGLNKLNQCNICGKTYAWKSGLYKHKRHVHNITGKTLNPVNDNVMEGVHSDEAPSPPGPSGPLTPLSQMSPNVPSTMPPMTSSSMMVSPPMTPSMVVAPHPLPPPPPASMMPTIVPPIVSQSVIQAAMPGVSLIAEQPQGIKA